MSLKENLEYLKISIDNDEVLDTRYMSIGIHDSLDEMVETTKEIKEILITIKRLNLNGIDATNFYNQLLPLVLSDLGSKNEFNGFINACDSAISTIKQNPETFKPIVDLYLEHRDISEHTPREWIQAIIDKGSQRSLGAIGENKIIELAVDKGFIHATNEAHFFSEEFAVIKFTKNFRNRINRDLTFGSQNKDLDIILKAKNNYCFIEAKHIKEGGGAQDKQIKELINLLNIQTEDNIKILSFMDGVYSNLLLDITEEEFANHHSILTNGRRTKAKTQRYEILHNLKNNTNAFWANTVGFERFLVDFKAIDDE